MGGRRLSRTSSSIRLAARGYVTGVPYAAPFGVRGSMRWYEGVAGHSPLEGVGAYRACRRCGELDVAPPGSIRVKSRKIDTIVKSWKILQPAALGTSGNLDSVGSAIATQGETSPTLYTRV